MTCRSLQFPRRVLRALGIVCAVIFIAAPASAQAPVVAFDGSEIFCHILKHFKFTPIRSIEDLAKHEAEATLIVIFGDLAPLDAIRKQAIELNDCALLIASDHPTVRDRSKRGIQDGHRLADSYLERWRLIIPGAETNQPEAEAYQSKRRFPFLKAEHLSLGHPAFRGITQGLATNRPSYLRSMESDLHLLARFGKRAYNQYGHDLDGAGCIYGTPGDSPERILILAGHGLFMNGLMTQSDNDNGIFAINAVRWLRDGPRGQRKYALMIHDGNVIESFDMPLVAPPQIPMPPAHVINRMLRELENEGIAHRLLDEVLGWTLATKIGLMALTMGLILYGAARLFPSRHRQEAVPLIVGFQPPPLGRRNVLEQRQYELLASDNLWEPAQALARQWFLDHAQVNAPLWDEAEGIQPPAAHYHAGWWARQKLAQQLAVLWSYAIRDPAKRVAIKEFGKLTDTLQALNGAIQARQIVFPHGNTAMGS